MQPVELGRCPGLPRKASLFAHVCCQHTSGRCQEGWAGWQAVGLWPWVFPEGLEEHGTLGIGPSPPSPWARRLETYVLEGQEDGEEESTEEKGHEQYKEHTLAGGEVKLQDIGGHQH